MRQFWTNAKIWTVIGAVVAALALKSELARRRRQLQSAQPRATLALASHRTEEAARAASIVANAKAVTPGGTAPGGRRPYAAEPTPRAPRRRLPRALVVAGIAAAALVPALIALQPSSSHPGATLTAEAADTPDGVMMMAHGSGFTPGQQVQLYWQHAGTGTVSTTASTTGEVDAAVALPNTDALTMGDPTGALPLTATDGTHVATQAVAVAPSSSVLGAASARVDVNGAPYFLLGANYPWVNYGNDFGSNAWGSFGVHSSTDYAADFAAMKAKGVHVVRWWVFADGRAGINYAADGTPLGVQPAVYDDLNAAIAMARQNDIYLDLVLFDFSLLSNPANVGGVQIGGRSSLISDSGKRTALVNNVIRPLAQAYGSEPMIASWELMNEPEWILKDLPQPAVNDNTQPVTMQQFWSYGSAASQMLHLYTHSMVTVGSASLKWNAVWTDAFAAAHGLPQLHLDFYQTHYYPWMDGWTINDPVLGHTTLSPLTQPVSGLNLDKPIVVGEISTPSGQAGNLLNTIMNNGYAGFWGWSYNSSGTGDKLAIDWSTFTPWEQAHASAVRIPAPNGAPPASPTARPATPTNTATRTAPTATQTATPKAPTATNTARAVAPTATNTARPAAPTATNTARPAAPTVTKTASPIAATPTRTTVPGPTATTVTPIQNFGHVATAGVNDSSDMGYINGTLASLPATGKLASLSVYVGATEANAHIRLALYTDGGTGPGVLIAQTGQGNAKTGWNTLPLSTNVVLQPGRYWIGALTDNAATVYRMADGMSASTMSGWSPQRYGAFPKTEHGWRMIPGMAFSMFGTVVPAGTTLQQDPPTATPTTRIPTATPTTSVPTVAEPTVVSTNTNTPTPQPVRTNTPTPTATRPPAPTPTATMDSGNSSFDTTVCPTKLDPLGRSQCGAQIHFCDTWVGGFCNDYRTKQTTMEMPFPQPGDATSVDCLSSTNAGQTDWLPYYVTTNNSDNTDVAGSQIIPFPCAISMNEHFMTRMEDGQFGMVVMRQQHPFDFAGRTGHIHFDVDLKTMERRYPRLVLSPQLTKMAIDDRNNVPTTAQSLEVWFRNGTFQVNESKNGQLIAQYPACNGCGARYYGQDNTRDSVDVYVSRTHIRIDVNGQTQVDTDIADTGFDRAYVYLDHLNYNSCKAYDVEGYATLAECQIAGNTFHWDDIAFDGPTLPVNSLTPAGSEDVVFNAWAAASCTVKGVAAQGNGNDYIWATWVARLPAGTPVSASDVICSGGNNPGFHWYRGVPMGLEVVHQ